MTNENTLRFTAYAWEKLMFFRDITDNEVGGFGLTAENDPLLVEDFILIKQEVSPAFIDFDNDAFNELYPTMKKKGINLKRYCRVWIHTHPGSCPEPSSQDEETFRDTFGSYDYSIMFILAKHGEVYCRAQFASLPVSVQLETSIVFGHGLKNKEWEKEYEEKVVIEKPIIQMKKNIPEWPFPQWEAHETWCEDGEIHTMDEEGTEWVWDANADQWFDIEDESL